MLRRPPGQALSEIVPAARKRAPDIVENNFLRHRFETDRAAGRQEGKSRLHLPTHRMAGRPHERPETGLEGELRPALPDEVQNGEDLLPGSKAKTPPSC
jgi:hypothetical protein